MAFVMRTVQIRHCEIGAGMPKICVPILYQTKEEIRSAGQKIVGSGADLVEWRVDAYEGADSFARIQETGRALRDVLGDLPILFTIRTAREGGERDMDPGTYAQLNRQAAQSGLFDLIDLEASAGEAPVRDLIRTAHQANVPVIASFHDFTGTPSKEELLAKFATMRALDADLLKIAVMPENQADVDVLLAATLAASADMDRPLITMSMGELGAVSRVVGEVVGSALTFGSLGKASAPGQLAVSDLKTLLMRVHESVAGQ